MTIEFRVLTTADELAPLPAFEKFIWGGESEMVSVNVLVATIEEGGVAIGAFAGTDLVGVVYGFPTREVDVLHSHYLAVHPDHRGRGLGEALKRRQAEWCRQQGIRAMRWTFDPLQVANAHLNLNKLGARGIAYRIDLYGRLGGINGSLPSDRLVVSWDLDDRGAGVSTVPAIVVPLPDVAAVDIATSGEHALAARLSMRSALAPRLADGWEIVGLDRAKGAYLLAPSR